MVKAIRLPATNVGTDAVLLTARSTRRPMRTVAEPTLFDVTGSAVPAVTVALFVTVPPRLAATTMVTVDVAPTAS